MQQQTRQRTRRERQGTPLPEKRGRKRQTTHRSHANTTHRHMVDTPAIPTHTKADAEERRGAEQKKREEKRRKERRREDNKKTQWCSGITCVLAGLRAHYPEHQHKEEEENREKRKTSNETTHPPFHNPQHNATRQDTHCHHTHHRDAHHNTMMCRQ